RAWVRVSRVVGILAPGLTYPVRRAGPGSLQGADDHAANEGAREHLGVVVRDHDLHATAGAALLVEEHAHEPAVRELAALGAPANPPVGVARGDVLAVEGRGLLRH